jgi:hypothetical protein
MSRFWLVLAMVVSLWPIAFVAVSVATDDSTTGQSIAPAQGAVAEAPRGNESTTKGNGGTAQSPSSEPDVRAYRALQRRSEKLLKQLDKSSAIRGVDQPSIAGRARALARDYAAWDAANGSPDPDLHRLDVAERRIALRVAAFAAAPSQARLDRFNDEITHYNRTLHDVQG